MRNPSILVASLAVVVLLVFPRPAVALADVDVESNVTTVVHYSTDVNGSYVIWFDQLIAETAETAEALFICEAMDGLYDAELDECTVDALPLYVESIGSNLDYFFHEL